MTLTSKKNTITVSNWVQLKRIKIIHANKNASVQSSENTSTDIKTIFRHVNFAFNKQKKSTFKCRSGEYL